jgi:flagellar motility protein MotE (MotC chaperone)
MNFRNQKMPARMIGAGAGSFILICLFVGGMQPLLDRVLGQGTLLATNAAADETHTSPPAENSPRGSHAEGDAVPRPAGSENEAFRDDPLARLTLALQKRQRELDERERKLNEEEERLKLLESQIAKQLAELNQQREALKAETESFQTQASAQRAKDVKKWFEIYQSMPPDKAAAVIEEMETTTAREILSKMDPKKATKILDAMEAEDAVALVGTGLKKGNR